MVFKIYVASHFMSQYIRALYKIYRNSKIVMRVGRPHSLHSLLHFFIIWFTVSIVSHDQFEKKTFLTWFCSFDYLLSFIGAAINATVKIFWVIEETWQEQLYGELIETWTRQTNQSENDMDKQFTELIWSCTKIINFHFCILQVMLLLILVTISIVASCKPRMLFSRTKETKANPGLIFVILWSTNQPKLFSCKERN